jgi:RNA polymerase primary sigma factor
LNEVGEIVGLSRERVRQIENRILKKLRKIAKIKKLEDLIL